MHYCIIHIHWCQRLYSSFRTAFSAVRQGHTCVHCSGKKNSIYSSVASLVACTSAIYDWLLHNSLSLNPNKSEVAIFGIHCSIQSRCDDIAVSVAGVQVVACDSFKTFSVILDNHMTFNKLVGNVCKAYNYHIRALPHIHASVKTPCQKASICNCCQQTQLLERPAFRNLRLISTNCRKFKSPSPPLCRHIVLGVPISSTDVSHCKMDIQLLCCQDMEQFTR